MGSGGKGGGGNSNQAHDYFGTIAGAVCIGIVDALVAIILDGKEVWPNAQVWASGKVYSINDLRSWGGRTWKCISNHTSAPGNAPPSAIYWVQYTLARAGDFADITIESFGQARIYWGTDTQTPHPRLQASGNEFGEDHPNYKGVCYLVLVDFLFGRERTSVPNIEAIVQRKPQQTVITGVNATVSDGQANMMAVFAELLTHWNGLAMDPATLDATTFQAVADYLGNNSSVTACAPLLDSQQTVREIIDSLEQLTDAFVRFNPATLLIEAGYYPHGAIPASVTVSADDLASRPKFEPQGWANAKSLAVVQFNDRTRAFKQTSDRVPDARAFRVLQELRPMTLDRPFITRRSQAIQHAAETIRTKGQPQLTGTLSVRRERARALTPGSYIITDIDLEPGGAQILQYFRIRSREVPLNGPISLTIEADVTLAAVSGQVADSSSAELPKVVPAFSHYRIIESPVLLADGEVNQVLIFAERPAENLSGFQLYFDGDSNGTFQVIGNTRLFACRATLRGDFPSDYTGLLQVNVPTQVDSDILTDTVNDLKAEDDQLLAILVKVDLGTMLPPFLRFRFPRSLNPLDTTVYQVAEDTGGYAEIEVCSISAIGLVSSGNYNLTVLRGRRATQQRAFTPVSCEVWIVRRPALEAFGHLQFDTLRSNRVSGVSDWNGYFRLAPYTHFDSRDLADCASVAFRFPKASSAGPILTLTAPTADSIQYPPNWAPGVSMVAGDFWWFSGAAYQVGVNHVSSYSNQPPNGAFWNTGVPVTYPYKLDVIGSWSDPNGDMVATQITIEKDNGFSSLVDDDSFTPIGSADISETVKISENGNWKIRLRAVDSTGLKSERAIRITALGTALKCATPRFYYNGKRVKGTRWNLYGKLKVKCATDGATISFRYTDLITSTDAIFHQGGWQTYNDASDSWDQHPIGLGADSGEYGKIEAFASKPGYTDSEIESISLKEKTFRSAAIDTGG